MTFKRGLALLLALMLCVPAAALAEDGEHDHAVIETTGTDIPLPEDCAHNYDYGNYHYNETHCWIECTLCGDKAYVSPHYAACTDPNHCVICGAESDLAYTVRIHNYMDHYNENYHWHECTVCGDTADVFPHYAACTDPNHCVICGAESDLAYTVRIHNYDLDHYGHDENYHWVECVDCHERRSGTHSATCAAPGHCVECGAEGIPLYIEHVYDDSTLGYDDTGHWYLCLVCGEKSSIRSHYASCTDPTLCVACGAVCAPVELTHVIDWETPITNRWYHWYACINCGEGTYPTRHTASCKAPTRCESCGAEGVSADADHRWGGYVFDGRNHWQQCLDCDAISEPQPHLAECVNPTRCTVCGARCDSAEIDHRMDLTLMRYDQDYHWYICSRCGEEFRRGEHYTFCGFARCNECDQTGVNVRWYHNEEVFFRTPTEHGWRCDCGTVTWRENHVSYCGDATHCGLCGADYAGAEVTHPNRRIEYVDGQTHRSVCVDCGEVITEPHFNYCADFNPNHSAANPNYCAGCARTVASVTEMRHTVAPEVIRRGDIHEIYCPACREVLAKSPHCTDEGDPAGVCSVCGAEYDAVETASPAPEPTAAPEPTEAPAEPTEAPAEATEALEATVVPPMTVVPAETETPAPTAAPATRVPAAAATEAPEKPAASFVERFRSESSLAAAGDLLTGSLDEPTTLTMDDADASDDYDGAALTVYPEGYRADAVLINLVNRYEPSALAGFKVWQATVTDADSMEQPSAYEAFVELARALIQALLPESDMGAVNALLVDLLRTEPESIPTDLALGEDVAGEIVGYLVTDGYELILVLAEDSVELLIRDAE